MEHFATCPACHTEGTKDDFDVLGADKDHVFCQNCRNHFNPSVTDETREHVREVIEAIDERLEGKAIASLMRKTRTTIKELSQRMGIPMKRIRQVRSEGLEDRQAIRDWLQGISGEDPGAV